MLISHELETRILNINYLLKQLDVTAAQRGQLLRLLENAESELLEVFGSDDSAPIAGGVADEQRSITLSLEIQFDIARQ
jgi:hypothetical protein